MSAPSARIVSAVGRASSRNTTTTTNRMSTPPIVGVPCFTRWPCGPSARTCWPTLRTFRSRIQNGKSSAGQEQRQDDGQEDLVRRVPFELFEERSNHQVEVNPSTTASSPMTRDAFTSTTSPGRASSRTAASGRRGVGDARDALGRHPLGTRALGDAARRAFPRTPARRSRPAPHCSPDLEMRQIREGTELEPCRRGPRSGASACMSASVATAAFIEVGLAL